MCIYIFSLQTSNFNKDPEDEFDAMKKTQENRPSMAMEYWSGWFDFWGKRHNTFALETFTDIYERILKYPASVNLYIFVGGTNFGFLSGAMSQNGKDDNSDFGPITTSYDYDAPIAENGDYTNKYVTVKDLLATHNPVKTKLPNPPALIPRVAYPSAKMVQQIDFNTFINSITPIESEKPISMELLPINNNSGQSYGYIVYRKEQLNLPANSVLKIGGRVCDTAMVLVNGVLVSPPINKTNDLQNFGVWKVLDGELVLNNEDLQNATVDIIVENWGRINVAVYNGFKGLWQGDVYLNNEVLTNWKIYPLEFNKSWIRALTGWSGLKSNYGPSVYRAVLEITGEPQDTYLNMTWWTKGLVIVNDFVLGRYSRIGPQQTLYLPAPLLKRGTNIIIVFEHFHASNELWFVTDPVFENH